MYFRKAKQQSFIIFSLFFFLTHILRAEDDVSKEEANAAENSNVDAQNPSPSEANAHNEIEQSEALDLWIKKTPKNEVVKEENPNIEEDEKNNLSQEDINEEERKVYQELINTYKQSDRNDGEIQRIFQKTILTKTEQSRIDKIKSIQRKIRKNVNQRYLAMLQNEIKEEYILRLCHVSYDAMGLSSEVKNFKPESSKFASVLWKQTFNEVIDSRCDLIMLSGMVAKTGIKTSEFLDKSKEYLNLKTGEKWNFKLTLTGRGASYSIFYDTSKIFYEKSILIDKVSLRRGGIFTEEKFSLNPSEFIFRDVKNSDRRFRIVAGDLVYQESPFKILNTSYLMQMSSAYNELAQNRAMSEPDVPVVLMLNHRFDPSHPAYHILVGSVGLEDFQTNGGCELEQLLIEQPEVKPENKSENESKEKKSKKIAPKTKDILKCRENFKYQDRKLFNTFNDLFLLNKKATKNDLKKLNSRKKTTQIGNFVLQSSLANVYSKDRNDLIRSGYKELGNKQLSARVIWTDFNFKKDKE